MNVCSYLLLKYILALGLEISDVRTYYSPKWPKHSNVSGVIFPSVMLTHITVHCLYLHCLLHPEVLWTNHSLLACTKISNLSVYLIVNLHNVIFFINYSVWCVPLSCMYSCQMERKFFSYMMFHL